MPSPTNPVMTGRFKMRGGTAGRLQCLVKWVRLWGDFKAHPAAHPAPHFKLT